MTFDPTSDTEASMKRSIHSHQVDCIDVVIVDYLQLLPRDWSGLALQQVQTWDIRDGGKLMWGQNSVCLVHLEPIIFYG